jgi:3-dehydroquinate synthase class II
MVAAFQDSNTALYATASTASDAQVYLEALEMGTDGVVLHTDDPLEVFSLKVFFMKSLLMLYLVLMYFCPLAPKFCILNSYHALNYLTTLQAYLDKRREANTAVKLVEAVVTRVEAVGMGDRVCVDLCNLLRPGEGLLVC